MNYYIKRFFICTLLILINYTNVVLPQRFMRSRAKPSLGRFAATFNDNLEKELPCLKNHFDKKAKGFGSFANDYLVLDYKHVLGVELIEKNGVATNIKGFHHDLNNTFRKSRIVMLKDTVRTKAGFYKSEIHYQGRIIAVKSFFPAHWPRLKVVAKIFEAYENAKRARIKPTPLANNRYRIRGKIREGVVIEMYIKDGRILTAYPLIG